MTGNTAELNDPANFSGRKNTYPNVFYNTSQQGPEPSIRGRRLYIPLNAWFCNNSRTAFPLVALQYNELQIDVVMRPVRELFVTRDINYTPPGLSISSSTPITPAEVAQAPFIQPNFNEQEYQFYRFLQPPPSPDITTSDVYLDKRTDWNADVHLLSTYCFLSAEESRVFASQEQKYLLKEAYEWDFKNITGSHRVELQNTMGMVATWMFIFQRSDINLRNQWTNYTNWPYNNVIPDDVVRAPFDPSPALTQQNGYLNPCSPYDPEWIGPGMDLSTGGTITPSGLFITKDYNVENQREILQQLGILLNGSYRENTLEAGVYNYVEKFIRTTGSAPFGLYIYNFGMDANLATYQPSGAINMSKFSTIELEFTTYVPPLDPSANFYAICDPATSIPIGVNKPQWRIYDYNYDLTVLEERYNVITFIGGNCALMYAR
jgi:hypothetical protein